MTAWLGWVMGDRGQDELEADRLEAHRIRSERPDLATATDAELLQRAVSLKPVVRRLFDQHINQSGAASIGPGVIGAVCAAVGQPLAAMSLMAGIGGVDSAAPSYAMWDLSRAVRSSAELTAAFDAGPVGLTQRLRGSGGADTIAFLAALDEFLVEFGSRGPNEWDIHSPTWETQPDLVLTLVDRMRAVANDASPLAENANREAERQRLGAELTAALAADPETQGQFAAALESAATFLAGRERSKTNIVRVIEEVRVAVWEIGRRSVERGEMTEPRDACLLFIDELDDLVSGKLQGAGELVRARRAHLHWLEQLEPPFILSGPPPANTSWPSKGASTVPLAGPGDQLAGIPGCPGVARGRAVIVLHPSDPVDLGPGDILVAPMTDPAWTPLFVTAAGVVVNVGAPLSHAIIVSRELGIPCVVSVNEATDRIPNGATIEVDGNTGTVTIVSLG
jgi:pyruvate,water dikinase